MRFLFLSVFILFLYSCKSIQETNDPINLKSIVLKEGCPIDADCDFELLKNKRISYQTDEADQFYPEFKEDTLMNVVKFSMSENQNQTAVDGQYNEEIYFEWPKLKHSVEAEHEDLQDLHFVFGRFCFCPKDLVGYFKIDKGNVRIEDGQVSFEFKTEDDIPQKLEKVSGNYILNK